MGGIPPVVELGPVRVTRPNRTQRVLVAVCMTLFAGGLVGLVVVQGEDAPESADRELARAQAFVQRARTAHFVGTYESVIEEGKGGLGSTYSDRARASGALEVPYKSRWIDEAGDYVTETVVVEHGSYFREADERAGLGSEQWQYAPRAMDAQDVHSVEEFEFSGAPFVASSFDSPDLTAMLGAAKDPQRVRPGVIKASVDLSEVPGAEAFPADEEFPMPKVTVEVHSEDDGRLTRIVLYAEITIPGFDEEGEESGTDTERVKIDVQFSRWGEPVDIAAPPRREVDPTPMVDEDDIAAFTATPLLAPRTLPAGFELLTAEVYAEEDDEDLEECAAVNLEYGNGDELEAFYAEPDDDYPATLDISLTAASCEYGEALEDGSPIRLGRQTGTIARGGGDEFEYATTIEVVMGATRVTITSDLPEKVVVAAASDLVPLDLAAQPVHRVEPPQ